MTYAGVADAGTVHSFILHASVRAHHMSCRCRAPPKACHQPRCTDCRKLQDLLDLRRSCIMSSFR